MSTDKINLSYYDRNRNRDQDHDLSRTQDVDDDDENEDLLRAQDVNKSKETFLIVKCVMFITITTWMIIHVFGSVFEALDNTRLSNSGKLLSVSDYSVITGFFRQDEPDFDPDGYDVLKDEFGLMDKGPERWRKFAEHIDRLNIEADTHTTYKVYYLARHGEGYHNAAINKYGIEAWDCRWSKLNGDGRITWGPDALLTPRGESQVREVNKAWKKEAFAGIPLPQSLYSSPLRRAATTLNLTWGNILLDKGKKPIILENLREMIGIHTCDKRSERSVLEETYPNFIIPLSLSQRDSLWNPIYQESDAQQTLRVQLLINELFATDPNTYISITAHSGVINAFFEAVGHRPGQVGTAGLVPVVVKAVSYPEATMPVITGG